VTETWFRSGSEKGAQSGLAAAGRSVTSTRLHGVTHKTENFKSNISQSMLVLRWGYYEDYYLPACIAAYLGKRPTFRRNKSPPSSGWKSKPRKKPAETGGKLSEKLVEIPTTYRPVKAWNELWTTRWEINYVLLQLALSPLAESGHSSNDSVPVCLRLGQASIRPDFLIALASCSACCLNLNMEVICLYETSASLRTA
jgi:hypothetical protein